MRTLLLVLALTALAAPAFPQPQSREEALFALQSAEAARRAEAVAWLAQHGAPADDGVEALLRQMSEPQESRT